MHVYPLQSAEHGAKSQEARGGLRGLGEARGGGGGPRRVPLTQILILTMPFTILQLKKLAEEGLHMQHVAASEDDLTSSLVPYMDS